MDAGTLQQRQQLGLSAFDQLRKAGVFGPRLKNVGAGAPGTTIYAQDGGDPLVVRFPLAQGPGYVDIAVQPWLGDPVLSVVEGVVWDPKAFEAAVAKMGCVADRWESYGTGDAALKCGEVWLDPNRPSQNAEYVRLSKDEVSKSKGLLGLMDQRQMNEQRFGAILAVQQAKPGKGPPSGTASAPSSPALPLCPLGAGNGGSCVPELSQVMDHWCVPAVLEMAIEYFLHEKKQDRYQGDLARDLDVTPLGMPPANLQKIPTVVNTVSSQRVSCAVAPSDWNRITIEIRANRPMVTIGAVHAFLVYGYTEAPGPGPATSFAYLQLVDPWGGVTRHDAFAIHAADTTVKFWSTQAASNGLAAANGPLPGSPIKLGNVGVAVPPVVAGEGAG